MATYELTLPFAADFKLYKNDTEYFTDVTAADYFASYTGATHYVSNAGSDTTGDGTSGNPYATVDAAITAASNLDIISISPGDYAHPSSPITKNLAFVRNGSSGVVAFGNFIDISGVTVSGYGSTYTAYTTATADTGGRIEGFVRKDTKVGNGSFAGAYASTYLNGGGQSLGKIFRDGFAGVYDTANTTYYVTGDDTPLQTLIDNNDALFWDSTNTGNFAIQGANVFLGDGIVLTTSGNATVEIDSSSRVVMGDVHTSTGYGTNIHVEGELYAFNSVICGSDNNNIDYLVGSTGLEVGIASINSWGNASTGHGTANILRVGGYYYNAPRVIHDIQTGYSLCLSLTVGAGEYAPADTLLISGLDDSSGTEFVYGDVEFVGTYTTAVDDRNPSIPIINSEIADTWSYGQTLLAPPTDNASPQPIASFNANELAEDLDTQTNGTVTMGSAAIRHRVQVPNSSEYGWLFRHDAGEYPDSNGNNNEKRFSFDPIEHVWTVRRIYQPENYYDRFIIFAFSNEALSVTSDWLEGDTVTTTGGTATYVSSKDQNGEAKHFFKDLSAGDWTVFPDGATVTNDRTGGSFTIDRAGFIASNKKNEALWVNDGVHKQGNGGYSQSGMFIESQSTYDSDGSPFFKVDKYSSIPSGEGTAHLTNEIDGPRAPLWDTADNGHFVTFVVERKRSSSANDPTGLMRIWKKVERAGSPYEQMTLVFEATGIQQFHSDTYNGFSAGYLFGASNGGFDEQTDFLLNYFEMYSSRPAILDGVDGGDTVEVSTDLVLDNAIEATFLSREWIIPYDIVNEIELDFILDNAIEAFLLREWIIPYRIVNGVELDFVLDWSLIGGLTVDLVLDHAITQKVAKDIKIQYTISVIEEVSKDLEFQYDIVGGLTKNLVFDYEITTSVVTECELQWFTQGRTDSIVGTNKLCPGKESRKLKIYG